MAEISEGDINQPGGWLVEVRTLGGDPEYYKVYELDPARAVELVKESARVPPSDNCVAVKQLNVHDLTGDNMTPGQVKQHWGGL